jgi:hypothetical protein
MNHESGFPYPEWQIPAQDVLIEIDADKLLGKVQRAEAKIAERLQQIQKSKNAHHEREAINHALTLIRAVKDKRLGFGYGDQVGAA